jgi:hypothetical protein
LQCLEQATARLAGLNCEEWDQLERVLAERSRAIDGIARWIAVEQKASRPVSPELACHLTTDLENGAAFLLRMALHRETTRLDLLGQGRELQILRSLSFAAPRKRPVIDCQG